MTNRLLHFAPMAAMLVAPIFAEPIVFTNLGSVINTQANYATPDLTSTITGLAAGQIVWFRFDFSGTDGTSFFLDIDTTTVGMTPTAVATVDTELGLYDSLGNLVGTDDDGGQGNYSWLSFGNDTLVRTYDIGGGVGAMGGASFPGIDGPLGPGTYWLAVGAFDTTFGATNWDATSAAGSQDGAFDLNFRTDVVAGVPEPSSYALVGLGLLGVAWVKRRRTK